MNKKHNTRSLRQNKIARGYQPLQMLTCYDFQSAQMLSQTDLDLILVGDSLGNVILGYDETIQVTIDDMITFCAAVKRGAKNKFVVGDLPFGTYATIESALENAIKLFQKTGVESVKLEGASELHTEIIKRITLAGIPVMGHIGLVPQSVHQMGGYFTHGKDSESAKNLISQAMALEEAGCFAIVLECVEAGVASQISQLINIPTIGIGSGNKTDGQVLVLNDLLKMGAKTPPKFCTPIADLFELKRTLVQDYLDKNKVVDGQPTPEHTM